MRLYLDNTWLLLVRENPIITGISRNTPIAFRFTSASAALPGMELCDYNLPVLCDKILAWLDHHHPKNKDIRLTQHTYQQVLNEWTYYEIVPVFFDKW